MSAQPFGQIDALRTSRGATGDGEGSLDTRVVGRKQDPVLALHGQNAIPRLQMKSVGHVLGQRRADRPTGPSECKLLDHAAR
jgi:hypothetical protein